MKRLISETWAVVLLLATWSLWVRHSGLNGIVIVTPLAVARELLHNPSQYVQPALHTIAVALFGIVGRTSLRIAAGHRDVDVEGACRTEHSTGAVADVGSGGLPYPDTDPDFRVRRSDRVRHRHYSVFSARICFCKRRARALPPMAEEYFFVQGAGRWSRLWRLALPAAVPRLAVALRVLSVQSVLAALIAEFLMQTGGLGSLIATSTADLAMDQALAASFVSVLIAFTLYLSASMIERSVLRRYN